MSVPTADGGLFRQPASGKLRKAADKLPFSYLDEMYFSLHQTLAQAEGGKNSLSNNFLFNYLRGETHREAKLFHAGDPVCAALKMRRCARPERHPMIITTDAG